jgi:hypothetical protein
MLATGRSADSVAKALGQSDHLLTLSLEVTKSETVKAGVKARHEIPRKQLRRSMRNCSLQKVVRSSVLLFKHFGVKFLDLSAVLPAQFFDLGRRNIVKNVHR